MTKLTVAFHNFVNMPKNKQNKKRKVTFVKVVQFLEICGIRNGLKLKRVLFIGSFHLQKCMKQCG